MKTKPTYRFITTGVLALGLAVSGLPAQAANNSQIIEGVHTDAISADIANGKLELFTYADLPSANHSKLNSDNLIFFLPDNAASRQKVPAGYEFIASAGSQIWLAPQTQIQGLLWPGWNTQDISTGEVVNDSLTMELTDAKVPEGGSVEIFQDPQLGQSQPHRVWSSDEDFKSYVQPVNSHVHANWAFTKMGTYELTFKVSGTLIDGTPIEDTQTYIFAIGQLPQAEAPTSPSASPSAPAETTAPAPAETTAPAQPKEPAKSPVAEESQAQPQNKTETSQQAKNEQPAPAQEQEAPAQEAAPQNATEQPAAPVQQEQAESQNNAVQNQAPSNQNKVQAPQSNAFGSQNNSGSNSQTQAQPIEKCMAVEELVEAAPAEEKTAANQTADTVSYRLNRPAFTVKTVVDSNRNQVTEGHFDFGAVLSGNSLTAKVKDDRNQPAQWVTPSSLNFILGDAAKATMPAGMEHIAPAGSEVYLIGATQQAGVPWLGWNTQDPELIKNSAGPAKMTLKSLDGPGKLSVFLSGNFGAKGTTVFDGVGSSFEVPANTHQHGNWVFTKPGNYRATIEWTVKLKDGSTKTSEGTLNFAVGNVSAADSSSGEQQQDKGSENKATEQKSEEKKQDVAPSKDTAQKSQRGTVDTATGIVTKPDGSKVRVVGKTASGADCQLSASELKEAQQASAEGKLAYTGTSHVREVAIAGSLVTLAGVIALLMVRRRRNA